MTGRLARRLTLQRAGRLPDGAGGWTESWDSLGTVWAQIRGRTVRTRGTADLAVDVARLDIRIRASQPGAIERPIVGDRFREGSRFYVIHAVREEGRTGRWLMCTCSEEVSP